MEFDEQKKSLNKRNKTLGSIVKVTISNVLKLLAGVLVGFLLPKIIGITDYGFYKTFTLYATYIGLAVLGISDGIYLKFGGKSYEELNNGSFHMYTIILFLLQVFLSIVIAIVALFFLQDNYRIIFVALAVYVVTNNMTVYYQMISQITCRFNEFSMRTTIQSFITSGIVFVLWLVNKYTEVEIKYWHYLILYLTMFLFLMSWYMVTYKDITFKKVKFSKDVFLQIFRFIKIGFPLMISNLCSTLILTIDRQFVNILFNTDIYAVYAFAYNMLSLITTATSAIATVLYPIFKRSTLNELRNKYGIFISLVLMFVFVCLLVYFPLCWFVNAYLPQYSESLAIFRVILPGLAFSAPITIVMHNYYKIEGNNVAFFVKSLIVLALSFIADLIVYYLVGTTLSISIVSIIVMFVWFLIIDLGIKNVGLKERAKNYLFVILSTGCFYLITMIGINWLGLVIQLVVTCALCFFFYFKDVRLFFATVSKKRGERL